MNNNLDDIIKLKNELYESLAMHSYRKIADFEEMLVEASSTLSDRTKNALVEHIRTVVEISLESYATILQKF